MSDFNKQNDNKEIEEDTPVMQSVALRKPPAHSLLMRPELSKPIGGATVPRISEAKEAPSTPPPAWTVSQPPSVPEFHRMERTHVYIREEPQVVATRIAKALHKESVAAQFDSEDVSHSHPRSTRISRTSLTVPSQACVDAETMNGVRFCVRLWTVEDQVVVESQRLSGCGFSYCQTAKSILNAAKGSPATRAPRTFTIPSCVPKETEEQAQANLKEALSIAVNMWRSNKIDAQRLAMESLVQLTTVCRDSLAHLILCGEFAQTLESIVEKPCGEHATEDERMIRRSAMTVLANCLSVLESAGQLGHVLNQQSFLPSLVSVLSKDLENSRTTPHEACQAVRCLQHLKTKVPAETRWFAMSVSGHAQLQNECHKLEQRMGQF